MKSALTIEFAQRKHKLIRYVRRRPAVRSDAERFCRFACRAPDFAGRNAEARPRSYAFLPSITLISESVGTIRVSSKPQSA